MLQTQSQYPENYLTARGRGKRKSEQYWTMKTYPATILFIFSTSSHISLLIS